MKIQFFTFWLIKLKDRMYSTIDLILMLVNRNLYHFISQIILKRTFFLIIVYSSHVDTNLFILQNLKIFFWWIIASLQNRFMTHIYLKIRLKNNSIQVSWKQNEAYNSEYYLCLLCEQTIRFRLWFTWYFNCCQISRFNDVTHIP